MTSRRPWFTLGLPKTFALSPYAAKAGAARLVFGNFSYLAIRHNNYFFKIPSSEKKPPQNGKPS